jgi:hypothetical protein
MYDTTLLTNEIDDLRIALLIERTGEPVEDRQSRAAAVEPPYLSNQPALRMTALWGN